TPSLRRPRSWGDQVHIGDLAPPLRVRPRVARGALGLRRPASREQQFLELSTFACVGAQLTSKTLSQATLERSDMKKEQKTIFSVAERGIFPVANFLALDELNAIWISQPMRYKV
ncbi:hypothetical protein A6R68_12426, partial [Neotoma lepida]